MILLLLVGAGFSGGNLDDRESYYDLARSGVAKPTTKLLREQDEAKKVEKPHQRKMQEDTGGNGGGNGAGNNGGLPACRDLNLRTCRPTNVSRRHRNLETARETAHPSQPNSKSFSSINNCNPVIVSREVDDYIIVYEGANLQGEPSDGELFDLLTVTKKFWFDFFQFTLTEFVDMEITVIGVQQNLGRNSFGTPNLDRRRLQALPDFGQTFTNGRVAFEEPSPRSRLDDDRRLQVENEDPYFPFFELSYMAQNADFECYLDNVRMIPAFRNTQRIIFNAMDLPGTIAPTPAPTPSPVPSSAPTIVPIMDPTPAPTLAPFWAPFSLPPPPPPPPPQGTPWWLKPLVGIAIIPHLIPPTPTETPAALPCSVCPPGKDFTMPAGIVPPPPGWPGDPNTPIPCGKLENFLSGYTESDELCELVRGKPIYQINCGCEPPCSVCLPGTILTMPNTNVTIPGTAVNITCQQLDSLVSGSLESDGFCTLVRDLYQDDCGCTAIELSTLAPTIAPTGSATLAPKSQTSTLAPTQTPAPSSSVSPSAEQTNYLMPSFIPSTMPSDFPSDMPSNEPTKSLMPSNEPTKTLMPSDTPSMVPSYEPTESLQVMLSFEQTKTVMPSDMQSLLLSHELSPKPTTSPLSGASEDVSSMPSDMPSLLLSYESSTKPTKSSSTAWSNDVSTSLKDGTDANTNLVSENDGTGEVTGFVVPISVHDGVGADQTLHVPTEVVHEPPHGAISTHIVPVPPPPAP